MNSKFNYDKISTAYADLVVQDPSKRFAQYPWALAQLPSQVCGLRILDIGCGEGSLARVLARSGAFVCGYDNSIEQIRQARLEEKKEPLGIEYIHADPIDIVGKAPISPFDISISVAVLHYATDRTHLEAFFSSTYQLVKPGGFFAALVMNSDFKRYEQKLYNRIYRRQPGGRLQADFLDATGVRCTADYLDFTHANYEETAALTGWKDFTWCPVKVTDEGKAELGSFWDGFEEDCPYAGFRVVKPLE
ncbi:MAG: methyltransferase domain-containing protein [Desulfuromonadales bacterium]|nr:methyltransferase domain-containing protein [Desulfuromonadales bacterium]